MNAQLELARKLDSASISHSHSYRPNVVAEVQATPMAKLMEVQCMHSTVVLSQKAQAFDRHCNLD